MGGGEGGRVRGDGGEGKGEASLCAGSQSD